MPKILRPFWSYVDKTSDCWLWTGAISSCGYGCYGKIYAHREAWERTNGRKIAYGKDLHHKPTCPRRCVNPEHLTELTKEEHGKLHPIDASLRCNMTGKGKRQLRRKENNARNQ